MAQLGKRFLVHIRLGGGKPATARIPQAAPGIKKVLESLMLGSGNCQLAYSSHDGATMGFFLKTTLTAGGIRAQLQSPGPQSSLGQVSEKIPPPLLDEDSIIVMELGPDSSAHGLGKAVAWLQHH